MHERASCCQRLRRPRRLCALVPQLEMRGGRRADRGDLRGRRPTVETPSRRAGESGAAPTNQQAPPSARVAVPRGQLATESSGFLTSRCASAGDAALEVASLGPTRLVPSDRPPHPSPYHKPAADLPAVTGAERSKPPPSPASTSAGRASTRQEPKENHCWSTTGTKAWRQSRSHPRSQSRSQDTARRPLPESEEASDLLI